MVFSGVLENGMNNDQPAIRDLLFYHGVTLTFLWYFLADIAVWVKYQYWIGQRVTIHALLMTICMLVTALAINSMIDEMEPDER